MRLIKADLEMRQMEMKIWQIESDLRMRQIEAGFVHEAECARY